MFTLEERVMAEIQWIDHQVVWNSLTHSERCALSSISHLAAKWREEDQVASRDDALSHVDESINVKRLAAVWQ